jgi:hypothetical protein
MSAQALDRDAYLAWEKHMGFDRHGGAARAAEALGVSTETIRRLRTGAGEYSAMLALAMMALAAQLPPWPAEPVKPLRRVDRISWL